VEWLLSRDKRVGEECGEGESFRDDFFSGEG